MRRIILESCTCCGFTGKNFKCYFVLARNNNYIDVKTWLPLSLFNLSPSPSLSRMLERKIMARKR